VAAIISLMSRAASYGSAIFMAAMMLITVADVTLRAVANLPITGAYDLVQLFLVGTIFLSIPEVFQRDENIVIDFIDHIAARKVIDLLKLGASLAALSFLVVLAWRMIEPAIDAVRFHEVSPDLSVPMIVHWVLMITVILLSLLSAVLMLVENLRRLLTKQATK
jgi:TRAP-type C4-dicarboxylate transport system permease small subunit